jgi:hypothetical protein
MRRRTLITILLALVVPVVALVVVIAPGVVAAFNQVNQSDEARIRATEAHPAR